MKKIAIIGAGGLGKEIWNLINAINKVTLEWEIVGFYDDGIEEKTLVLENCYCLNNIDSLKEIKEKLAVVFAIEDRKIVQAIWDKLASNDYLWYPNLIHPSVEISTNFECGIGNILVINSNVSCDVTIGDFNLLNGFVGLGHDVKIGSFNSFMPRVQISGNVEMGDFNFFGMNSAVVQGKTLGDYNTILSYTFLTKNIINNSKYFGIPGRKITTL